MSQTPIVSGPGRERAYRLLALVGLLVALLVAWTFWDAQRRTIADDEGRTEGTIVGHPVGGRSGAELRQGVGEGAAAEPSVGRVRGQIIDTASGPLSEGRVELHCEGGFLAAVSIDEEGVFEGPA